MTYQIKEIIECIQCGRTPAVARKLCRSCYTMAHRKGELANYAILGPKDVFEGRIDKTGDCWLWKGTKNSYGYGIFLLPGEKPVRAHRYAYEHFIGPIPEGMIIRHTCDNPPCVNPAHLKVGTKAENNADTAKRRRHNYGTDHWNGRLTKKQIAAIRRSKATTRELATKYGVHYSHIYRIRSGEFRKNG
jgi:hypothetical protein